MSTEHNEKAEHPEGVMIFPAPEPGEEVVITGLAGRFPDADNLKILQEKLFDKVDLVSDDDRRWKLDHPEIPQRTGKINDVGKFDSLFFGVHFKQAHTLDPMCRMLLEHAYEAVVDAGVNPRQLRGTNTGVFVGACFSESEKTWFYEKLQVNGFGITGCSRAMLANRISYWLGANGPSYTIDSACSSGLFALDHAYRAIRTGQCDAAIVGASNLCLHPYVSLQFSRLGVLSSDGRCKSFDADADGYARSETISVVFLQKAKDAKRIYAQVVHTKTNCDGYKEQGITCPSSIMQSALLEQFYQECQIPPSILSYVEAHGTGIGVGDTEELNALDKVFCPGRTTPLRIGSIKSNLGHSEPASGLCSIAKMVIAMESGYIPPNLNYNRPREGVKALEDGRIKVITDLTPWEGGYVGVNSFGFGGANAHILLKSHTKEKIDGGASNDDLPRLVVASGRTEEAVFTILDDLLSKPVDVEYISLFHGIHAEETPGHLYRGYTILPPQGLPAEDAVRDVQHYPGAKRPVWFVFSGMGSQWAGMGESLLKIPVFAKAIEKCDAVLKPHGVDIIDILTNKDPKMFDNILNSFVGIAAVQIGLVDVLTSLGIVPNNIIGHSVGELGCAYADGCFTAEQMVLAAYSRGLASIETDTIHGSMAAVGLGYEDVKDLCPPDIEVACHNSPESSTISGPADSMKEFVAKLQGNGIFAREVPCSNIAYHSRYIAAAGPKLLAYLKKVIPDPKPRSSKWLSTSVPRNNWTTNAARLSSAEYHTNNLLSPVLFEETAFMIPNNAITIEIAPHGLLQAIIRRSLNEGVTNIALTKRGHKNNVEMLLQGIGKMYEAGMQPELSNLYPKVEFPVSRGTSKISPLVRWEHSDDWYVTSYRMQDKFVSGERNVKVTLSDNDFEWMAGHVIDGRNFVPPAAYLTLIWETFGMLREEEYTELPVVFEDVKFLRATIIPKKSDVELTLMVQKGSGRFEVSEGSTAIVTGLIRALSSPAQDCVSDDMLTSYDEELDASSRDVYKELRLRGYYYSGLFRGIREISLSGKKGRINWTNNWVAFIDNMVQMQIIGIDTRELIAPTSIQKLVIDTKAHSNQVLGMPEDDKAFDVEVDKDLDIIVSGGVQIRGLKTNAIARKKAAIDPVIEDFKFVAHRDRAEMPLSVITRIATHIALENQLGATVKTIEIIGESDDASLENLTSPTIQEILDDLPLIQANVNIFAPADKLNEDALPSATISGLEKLTSDFGALLAVGHKLLASNDTKKLKLLQAGLSEGGFFLAREPLNADKEIFSTIRREDLKVILEKRTDKELIILLRKKEIRPKISAIVKVNGHEFDWLSTLQAALKTELEKESNANGRILVVSEGDCESGVMGLVNCLRKEPGGEAVRGFFIKDLQAPEFSLKNQLFAEQIELDLALNVLHPGRVWGSYRFFNLEPLSPKPVYHTRVAQFVRGDLSSLKWVEGILRPGFKGDNIIKLYYSSLNFRDIMIATGRLAQDISATRRLESGSEIGLEFVGKDANNRKVMGMVPNGSLANFCMADDTFIWPVPDNWTLEDAATVPVVYSTAYYALVINGKIKHGEKVLIHAGSGGVGQAAITIALSFGCEVFTTVGTAEKREFIRTRFPQIDDDHIGNSRDTSFEQLILTKTDGEGVDIVLNSLTEERLQASVRCLANGGRFLEIGKLDLVANNPLGMEAFLKEIGFYGIVLDNVFSASNEKKAELGKLITQGLKSGVVKPLVRTVFPADQIEAAFRYLATGKHIGKVILKVRDEDEAALPLALPRYYCSEDRSYLILGGLGGFGLELVDWLVLRGARKIVLTSRKGISNGYQRMRIRTWESYGIEIVIIVGKDASTYEGCKAILESAAALGPVDAIFNLAGVLKDALCENQTPETFEESLRVKAWATKQLDKLSRKLCPDLRKFVVFSSVSCGRGNAGQTNYGMANSIMERICEKRVSENLPGLAIEWGAVGDVGLVAEMQEDDREVSIGGTLQQKISSCLEELDGFLLRNSPVVSSMVVAKKRADDAKAINIVDTVANIMGLEDLKTVSPNTPLAELGMDSMMPIEIKQTLEREFELFLTEQDIRSLNFAKLEEISLKEAEKQKNRRKEAVDDSEEFNGIQIFVPTVATDELITDVCVPLDTKAQDGRGEVFIIPGIEGTYNVFQTLAGKLKSPTTCLQLETAVSDSSSVDEIADRLLLEIEKKIRARRTFVLVGYSFGSLVAIELVRRLEAKGLNGRLVLIDGSPDHMKALVAQTFITDSDDQLQNSLLSGIIGTMDPSLVPEYLVELENFDTWDKKLESFVKKLSEMKNVSSSPEVQRRICTSIYHRIKAIINYDPSALPQLRTPIILLKPTSLSVRLTSEDYGLKKITRENVEVHDADGNYITILDNDICATAINGDPMEDVITFKKRIMEDGVHTAPIKTGNAADRT